MKKFTVGEKVKEVRSNYCPNLVEGETASPLVEGVPFTSRHEILMINENQCNILLTICKDGKDVAYGSAIYNTRDGELEGLMFDETKEKEATLRAYVEGLIEKFKVLNDIEYQKALKRPIQSFDSSVKEKRSYKRKSGSYQRKGYYRHDSHGNLYYVRATVCLDEE